MSHSLYTGPIETLTFDDVVAFCAPQPKEYIRLEYKETFSSKDAGKQIAKEVCAFANTQGGLLIFGVAEQGDRLPEKKPEGRPLGKEARDRVIQACHANIFPPVVYEISEFLTNPAKAEAGFLVIRVAPSPEIPHTMEDGRRVYIRVHDKSEPVEATVAKIEHMLERRNARVSLQAERMDRGINRLVSALGIKRGTCPNSGGFIAVGIGPVIMDAPDAELAKQGMRLAEQEPESLLEVSGTVDGWYAADPQGSVGWLVDDYGNIVFVSPKSSLVSTDKVGGWTARPSLGIIFRDDPLHVPVALLSLVLKPLCLAVDASSKFCAAADLLGLLRLRFICSDILGSPLAISEQARTYSVVAATLADTGMEFSFDFRSSDFGPEGWNVSLRAASKLLRGWGASSQIKVGYHLDIAERSIFGETGCDCDPGLTHPRPRNHERCMKCRM